MPRFNERLVNRRSFVRSSTLAVAGVLLQDITVRAALTSQPKSRKNIEDLTSNELDNYVHALNILKNRRNSASNSYFALAQIHNSTSVPCEHGSYLFLPWHRALLYLFELALQQSDPPKTSQVAIPYYDFTTLPKSPGKRYPAVFEDAASILGQMWTAFGWQKSNRQKGVIAWPFYTQTYMNRLIDNNPNWASSNLIHGGSINGFGGLSSSGKGALESPSHDAMHDVDIGGQLRATTTAADDPIFWSFHCFLDLVWHRWQQKYPEATIQGQDEDLRGMPQAMKCKDVLRIEEQLNYRYEDTQLSQEVLLAAGEGRMSFAQENPHIVQRAGDDPIHETRTYDLLVPDSVFDAVSLIVPEFRISAKVSFRGYVYLHPKSVPFNPESEAFRLQYLVDHFAVLAMKPMKNMDQAMKTDLSFDLRPSLAGLAAAVPGQEWGVTVTISAQSIDDGRVLERRDAGGLTADQPPSKSIEAGQLKLEFLGKDNGN